MATRMIVELEDDLTGGPADETVEFSLDGKSYEVDLNEANATKFRRQFVKMIEVARPMKGKAQRGRRLHSVGARPNSNTTSGRDESKAIRAWAAEQGIDLNQRGRIPASVVEQYHAS